MKGGRKPWRWLARALLLVLTLVAIDAVAQDDEDQDDTEQVPADAAPPPDAPTARPSASAEALALLPPERRAQIDGELRRMLDNKSYAFCHDPTTDLAFSDEDLCPLAEAARPRCPAFVAACERARQAQGCNRDSDHGGCSGGNKHSPTLFSLAWFAELVSLLARGLLWLVTIGIVVFIAVELARAFRRRSRDDEPAPAAVSPDAAPLPIRAETDSQRLLARARGAAARGDFRGAVDDLYRALLRYLDANALIELHPSRTNGDYVRQLSPNPDLAQSFRDLARELERVQFGRRLPTAELFAWLETRIVPIVSRVAVVLLVIGVSLFTNGCKKRNAVGDELTARWCGTEPAGYGVFCGLMSGADVSVRQRVRPLDRVEDDVNVVVVVTADLPDEQWAVLRSWAEEGGRLVLAAHPTPLDRWAMLELNARLCGGQLELSPALARGALQKPEIAAPENATFAKVSDDSALARCKGDGYVVERWLGDGSVVALPSPQLLTNASLAAKDNALLVTALIHPGTGVVEMIGPWTGSGSPNPFTTIARAGLGPWMLQVLALMAVLAWSRGRRFGSARALVTGTRHAFVEHVRALGERYRRRTASRFVLVSYGAWALERLRERFRSQGRGQLSDLAEALARRTGQDIASVMRLLVDVRGAQDDSSGDSSEHLRTLRALAELLEKLESSGEHRRISSTLR